MKKINLLIVLTLSILLVTACKDNTNEAVDTGNNSVLKEYDTPFGVPAFDKISTSDYLPAIKAAINEHNKEIDAIINNSEAPTFENTILAYDKSGEELDRVTKIFYCISSNITNSEIQKLSQEITPLLSNHRDEVRLNDKLFNRIKEVYNKRNESGLTDNQIRCVDKYYNDFKLNGATLIPADKDTLKSINANLAKMYLKFDENLLAETNNFKMFLKNKNDLAGLPQNVIDAAAKAATEEGHEGEWLFTTKKPSMIPFLQFSDRRDLREKLYRAYFTRCDQDNSYDNKKLINDIANERVRKANMLGFKSFAEYRISMNMAKDPITVLNFITDIWYPALDVAKKEAEELQNIINKEGGKFKLESWDWWYYAEKLRKQKYDLDENELKPYFQLDNVRNGMFYVSNKLYDINFTKLENVPTYAPEVEVFEIKDADFNHLGIIFFDYYPRPGKGQGAWCSSLREGGIDKDGNRVYPIITVTCNFTSPTDNTPALLTLDEAQTLFHEFGHALHGLFSFNEFSRLSGDMPRDMIEFPSQIMENWALHPQVLKEYAKHYQTGEAIPDKLIKKIENSSTFNTGFNTTELIAATLLDLNWNSRVRVDKIHVSASEKNYLNNLGLIPQILPRYRSTYFAHIFTGEGYAAGYYVYTWAEVLEKDAFEAFVKSGDIFNKELADKLRKYILTECGNDEPMKQYVKFRGQEPSNEPYLKARGLK